MRLGVRCILGFSIVVALISPMQPAMAAGAEFASGAEVSQRAATADDQRPYVDSLIDSANAILNLTGKRRNVPRAIALLEEAVKAGNPNAMRRLAAIMSKGDGVPADSFKAEGLLKQAIAAGDVAASALSLGDLYRADTPLRDEGKAVAAYQQSADAGNTSAMRKLAAILMKGDGVPADPVKAEGLLRQAIAAGDVGASAVSLGDRYRPKKPLKGSTRAADASDKAGDAAAAGGQTEGSGGAPVAGSRGAGNGSLGGDHYGSSRKSGSADSRVDVGMIMKCREILANPASYEDSLIKLCRSILQT